MTMTTTGEKIFMLRHVYGITQDNLAETLEVSRQTVSRWESNLTLPETDKLVTMSKLFHCTVNDLLINTDVDLPSDGESGMETAEENSAEAPSPTTAVAAPIKKAFEYKSERSFMGLPLVHVCLGASKSAKGIIAIGGKAEGVIAIGLFSFGVISVGVLAIGLIALGALALGIIAAFGGISLGAFSFGFMSIGAIAHGWFALGLLSYGYIALGDFACGNIAVGNYFAYGYDYAVGMISAGGIEAGGSMFGEAIKYVNVDSYAGIYTALLYNVPKEYGWALEAVMKVLINRGYL